MNERTERAVIREVDPLLAEHPHLDFDALRREGLAHLGELSGKMWTDHNTHDPGITILEVLCYALIDLGYRVTRPVEDLLATPQSQSAAPVKFPPDDNFFTPLEILSCNPTTIEDYRRLLLEVDGVRNAWLTPFSEEFPDSSPTAGEAILLLDPSRSEAEGGGKLTCGPVTSERQIPIHLHGLYRVVIEKQAFEQDDQVRQRVLHTLSAHRNLCEDVIKDITILRPIPVGVCADVEIVKDADPALVHRSIIKAVRSYITPEIEFYTLKQLLEKGTTIEEAFAGRAFLAKSKGFVDLDELRDLPVRGELHASELYRIVMGVEGVVSIRNLGFRTEAISASTTESIQRLSFPAKENQVSEFSIERTCIQLRDGQGLVNVPRERVEASQAVLKKPSFERVDLDLPIPQGRFSPELAEYQSVQSEFPAAYGIGSGGLPSEATPERRARALQLQGYLLFYDQLLANYVSQVANVRRLFSLRPESVRDAAERSTYFTGPLDHVPGIDRLLLQHAGRQLIDGDLIAAPVNNDEVFRKRLKEVTDNPRLELEIESCGSPVTDRAIPHRFHEDAALMGICVQQSMRDLDQGDYSLEIHEDRGGHFFILRFAQMEKSLLVGIRRYRDASAALEGGNFAAFLATMPDYYRRMSRHHDQRVVFWYDVIYNAAANAHYLQYLRENRNLYLERREGFLDHLLARFAHQFTDYSLLQFEAVSGNAPDRQRAIEDKSRFLSKYDELSRDRGRAFDYRARSWGTKNVSGFERRASLLAGMPDWTRRRLCKFAVLKSFRIEVDDPSGKLWISSKRRYHSEEELREGRKNLLKQLRDPGNYSELGHDFQGFNAGVARRIFSEDAAEENIEVSQYVFGLQLKNHSGGILQRTERQDYGSEDLAWRDLPRFLEEVRAAGAAGLELRETGKRGRMFLDDRRWQCRIDTLVSYKWYQYDQKGKPVAQAKATRPTALEAIADFANAADWSRFITEEDGFGWRLTNTRGDVLMTSLVRHVSPASAVKGLLDALDAARSDENFSLEFGEETASFRVLLATRQGEPIGATPPIESANSKGRNAALKATRRAIRQSPPPLQVKEEPPSYRWHLCQVPDGRCVKGPSPTFPSMKDAAEDFEEAMRQIAAERTDLEIAEHLYTVETFRIPARYRFNYWGHPREDAALPLFRSQDEFDSHKAAAVGYAAFVQALPHLTRVQGSVAQGGQTVAALANDTEENRKEADQLLKYLGEQYAEAGRTPALKPRYIYRVLDKDHPLARTRDFPNEAEARCYLKDACGFSPYQFNCGKQVIQLLTRRQKSEPDHLQGSAERIHYVLCLSDDNGAAFRFLRSYAGYESSEAACQAAETEWIRLIELASDLSQYGKAKTIAIEDIDPPTDSTCSETEPYAGVLTREFVEKFNNETEMLQKAVELAQRYPIRIAYKEDLERGCEGTSLLAADDWRDPASLARRLKSDRIGYRFQGKQRSKVEGTREEWEWVWRSGEIYDTPEEAFEGHRAFVAALGNRSGCEIVCEEGRYRIQLVEILAESRELDSEDEAWGNRSPPQFQVDHFAYLPSLARKLKQAREGEEPVRPIDVWLAECLSETTLTALAKYAGRGSDPVPLQEALAQDLNALLKRSAIFDEQRFGGITLRRETKTLKLRKPQGDDLERLNRLLIEDAYPVEVSRNPNRGVRLFADAGISECAFLPRRDDTCASPAIAVGELRDLPSFTSKLTQPGRPFDSWLAMQLSAETLAALKSYGCGGRDLGTLNRALLTDINRVLGGVSIYEEERFRGIDLRAETKVVLAKNPEEADLVRLNRLLLEDAYPLELASCARYSFIVVSEDYRMARHTCAYHTVERRNLAGKKLLDWVQTLDVREYGEPQNDNGLKYYLGEGYYLNSVDGKMVPGVEVEGLLDRWLYLATKRSNYEQCEGRWQLIDRLEGGTAVADVRRDDSAAPFNLDAFLELARQYPVCRKGEGYGFRLFYSNNAQALNESVKIWDYRGASQTGPNQAGPVRQDAEGEEYCGKPYVFDSEKCYPSRAEALVAFSRFMDLARETTNYENTEESGVGPYSFAIIDPLRVLARHPSCHRDMGDAMRAAERVRACLKDEGMHLLEHILLRPQGQQLADQHPREEASLLSPGCECLLPVCPDIDCKLNLDDALGAKRGATGSQYVPGSDPYSFWATLVLPGWYQRFKSSESRQFFKEMLHREAPAMVALNILWLSPQQMCQFEKAFRLWLDWRRCPELICDGGRNVLCNLVKCFTELHDDPPSPFPEIAAMECDCATPEEEEPRWCMEQTEQLFWMECGRGKTLATDHGERVPQAERPGAAAASPTVAPTPSLREVPLDDAAIRRTIAGRRAKYGRNVQVAGDKRIQATQGYGLAKEFVGQPPPRLDQYRRLVNEILEKDLPPQGEPDAAFVSLLENATCLLLDHLVMANPHQVSDDDGAALSVLFSAMRSRGIDTRRMAKVWQAEALETILHASVTRQYIQLLEHA